MTAPLTLTHLPHSTVSYYTWIILLLNLILINKVHSYTLMTTTNDCKNKCLSQGPSKAIFCPGANLKSGYCCNPATDLNCPRELQVCSSDFPTTSSMQLFMCPFESYCGSSSYLLNSLVDTQVFSISNATTTTSKFTTGGKCQYTFSTTGLSMKSGDSLLIVLDNLHQTTVDVVAASSNDSTKISLEQQSVSTSGMWFRVVYPDIPYLIFRS